MINGMRLKSSFLLSHQLSERVEVTGPCSAADVSAHLLAADLAVLPFLDGASYRRGSLLAALAHGVPTITTAPQTLLIPPLLDGLHARVVKKTDVTMLGKAIMELAVDEATRAQLATGGRTLAARFAWSSIAAQHENSVSFNFGIFSAESIKMIELRRAFAVAAGLTLLVIVLLTGCDLTSSPRQRLTTRKKPKLRFTAGSPAAPLSSQR
jgi:hypothetical protein